MKGQGIVFATIYLIIWIFTFIILYMILTPLFQTFINFYSDLMPGNPITDIVKNVLVGSVAFALAIPLTYFFVYAFKREPREEMY